MTPNPADEARHAPPAGAGDDRWSDAWQLDAWTASGIGLTVRLELFPVRQHAWYWTYLVLPDLPGPVVVRDHDVPAAAFGARGARRRDSGRSCGARRPSSTGRTASRRSRCASTTPTTRSRARPASACPSGSISSGRSPRRRTRTARRGPAAGYVLPGVVHGDVLLGQSRFELDAPGVYQRTWGSDPPVVGAWSWRGGGGDEFVFVEAGAQRPVDGFVWRGGASSEAITDARAEMHGGGGRVVVDASAELSLDVIGAAPVPLDGGLAVQRALCRATDVEGHATAGWWARVEAR
ncbi:MAG: hypothetical protein KatS3mg010_1343 [Acidimicrobiia bacterium]|nr:MAG: hypothetical protein KatS3mg010_1343 [Acidimicrobiia bacterium]